MDAIDKPDRRNLLCKQRHDGKRKDEKMIFTENMLRARTNSTDGSCVPGLDGLTAKLVDLNSNRVIGTAAVTLFAQ